MVEVYPSSYAYNGVATIPEDSPVDDVSRVAAAAVAARVLMGANYASRHENGQMTREEHAAMMQELSKKRAGWRTPRRGWSSTDTPVGDHAPTGSVSSPLTDQVHNQQLPEKLPLRTSHTLAARQQAARRPGEMLPPNDHHAPRPRPTIPPPRRSYSVTDHEPPAATHRPSVRMDITDLPAELHFAVFDFLDPIDSTCLGLTNKHFYNIHRRMHGSVPLSSRRDGPNDLEWAWRGAGPLVHPQPATQSKLSMDAQPQPNDGAAAPPALQRASTSSASAHTLDKMRVKGQVYCRKCGISRCELHRHLKEWMASAGKHYEYCAVTCKYGAPAPDDAKEFCHLKSPKKPHRCGRHASKAGSGTQTPKTVEPQPKA